MHGALKASGDISYATKVAHYLSDLCNTDDDMIIAANSLGASGVILFGLTDPKVVHGLVTTWLLQRGLLPVSFSFSILTSLRPLLRELIQFLKLIVSA